MKNTCRIFIHTKHFLLDMNTGHTLSCYKQLKQKIIILKCWVRIQWYTAVDFQGWSKITLKIKMAYISIFGSRFQKIL